MTASAADGGGQTVAVVAAYGDPTAAADLAVYRSHYKLPACSIASGCLRILNSRGGTGGLPAANSAWALTDSEELDAISALCPKCRLLLVEAASNSLADLGAAEEEAIAAGARFAANGWGQKEFPGQDAYGHYFNHPGSAIVFAAGNSGYGTSFPAALPFVTSVGGTELTRSAVNTRGWAETGWSGTGSGCSVLEPKPSWQRADDNAVTGCLNRTQNDVAADADPATGASVYDSYGSGGGWTEQGGTALAAAIITAAYALAGTPAARSYPASYPYQHASHLYDVTFGPLGCSDPRQYLCMAEPGYDGPTGLGTPDGAAAFAAAGTDPVTVLDPGTQDLAAGGGAAIRVTGLDTRAGAASLAYAATGLPAGLTVKAAGTSAVITGTLPAAVRSYAVTVTARDATTGKSASTRFSIVAAGSLALAAPFEATIANGNYDTFGTPGNGTCLDSGAGTAGTVITAQKCTGTAEQLFAYQPEGAPGAPADLLAGSLCVAPAAGGIALAACSRADAAQGWRLLRGGLLQDAGTGDCLSTAATTPAAPDPNPLALVTCDSAKTYQDWFLSYVKFTSAVPGMCADVDDPGTGSAPYTIEPCADSIGFGINPDGSVDSSEGRCLGVNATAATCDGLANQVWLAGPGGELINEGTGLCLDDPAGSATAGTDLTTADCYGQLGEIWGVA